MNKEIIQFRIQHLQFDEKDHMKALNYAMCLIFFAFLFVFRVNHSLLQINMSGTLWENTS